MGRHTKFIRSERGQSIILIAAVLLGLLAVTGLAIDGGNLFLQRRRAQNAADAGVMAGTRVLAQLIVTCQSGDSANDTQVAQAVSTFVANNGFSASDGSEISAWYVNAETERLGPVGGGGIPQSATGVEVQLDARTANHFLPVVGIRSSPLNARATALTGRVVQLSGILPIAVPLPVVEQLDPGDPFVVMENNHHEGGMFCEDANGNGQYDEGFDLCIGDPASHNAHRGWLNLNYIYNTEYLERGRPFYRTFEQDVPNRGCGPDPNISTDDGLQGWAGDGCPYPHPIFAGEVGFGDGDFIHGSPGARQSSLAEVVATYNGRVAYVPVFDFIYTSDYMAEHFPQPEGIGWPRSGGGGSAFLYHIVGYTAVYVDDPNVHDHTLAGNFDHMVIAGGMIEPGAGLGSGACQPLTLYGINLWR
jgi:hypothetical protein